MDKCLDYEDDVQIEVDQESIDSSADSSSDGEISDSDSDEEEADKETKKSDQATANLIPDGNALIQNLVSQLVAKELQNCLDTANSKLLKESKKRKKEKKEKKQKKGINYYTPVNKNIPKPSPSDSTIYIKALQKKRIDQSINSIEKQVTTFKFKYSKLYNTV